MNKEREKAKDAVMGIPICLFMSVATALFTWLMYVAIVKIEGNPPWWATVLWFTTFGGFTLMWWSAAFYGAVVVDRRRKGKP